LGGDNSTQLAAYDRASRLLLDLISCQNPEIRGDRSNRQTASESLAQSRRLLASLDYSPSAYPIVHITGTSGKGSTAASVAAILTAAGYRVGLRTSPYLQVATEKLQVGSLLVDGSALDRISALVTNAHNSLLTRDGSVQRLGHAEAWIVLSLVWFAERNVDAAIIEVGAGGRFDSTNIVQPTVSVITSVGVDHVATLGPTIADIAWHKAGIIKPGATVIVGDTPAEAWKVILDEAAAADVRIVRPSSMQVSPPKMLRMPGAFQQQNAAVAIATIEALGQHGFTIPKSAIEAGLSEVRLPGRLERMPHLGSPIVWIDGAHNADKIAALTGEIELIAGDGPLPVVVVGMLGAKDTRSIVSKLAPISSTIIATQPSVIGRTSLSAEVLAAQVQASAFTGTVLLEPDPHAALHRAESLAKAQGASVLVTGSMYLAGQVRRRWYPDAEIVLQRTPWPIIGAERPL